MEKLADSGLLAGVLDITTTEVCDLLFGGVLPAGEDRFDAIARTKIPYVGSVGALDMVNFWAPETVPVKWKARLFYNHNSNVTLMRTTAEECREIGAWIGEKLNACDGPVRFLIPEKGVSALDIEGGAFFDPEADAALFSRAGRDGAPDRRTGGSSGCRCISTTQSLPRRQLRPFDPLPTDENAACPPFRAKKSWKNSAT